jgi:hypothetical protein
VNARVKGTVCYRFADRLLCVQPRVHVGIISIKNSARGSDVSSDRPRAVVVEAARPYARMAQ